MLMPSERWSVPIRVHSISEMQFEASYDGS